MSTSTRRSTRARGGAASSLVAAAASPLQPVATNTPSKAAAGKKTAAAKNNGATKGKSKKSSSAAETATAGYTLRKRVATASSTAAAIDGADDDDNTMMVNHASLYSDRDFEALLRRHEEDGARARADKRRRLEGPHPYRPNPDGTIGNGTVAVALDQLPGPVVNLVFEYLPRCRDVLNLACLSKYLLSYVERRTDLVIRAAVHENAMAKIAPKKKGQGQGEGEEQQEQPATSSGSIGWGGTRKVDGSRKIMTQIAEDVRSRALRVPTPLRLLRLLCAQSCERGEGCWAYDAEKGTAGTRLGVDGAARPFGMAMCLQCSNDACRTVPRWWNHWGRTEEKILKIGNAKLFHPSAASDLTVGPDGERIGPFLDARQIMQLTGSYRNDGVDAQKEAFGKLCEEVYGKEGEDRYEEYEKAASEFVQLYDEAEESLEQLYAKQYDGKEDNRKAIIERKKETLVQIIAILEEAVENLPENLKALALEYWWSDDTRTPLRFALPLVHQKLATFIRAPSYATQKRVDDAVASIRDSLNTFVAHEEFTSFSFLTTPTAADHQVESEANRLLKSRLKQKLLNHVQQQDLSNLATLLSKHEQTDWYYYNPEDKFTPAFYDLLGRRSYKTALLNLLAQRSELSDIVAATLVVDGDALEAGDPIDHRNLTTTIYKKIKAEKQYDVATSSFADFVDVLKLCKAEYTKLSRAARDYLQQPGVIEYLAGAPQWGGGFTRARAIGQVWQPKDSILRGYYSHWQGRSSVPEGLENLKPYQLLSERKFDKLLKVHKYYHRSGSAYTVH